MAVAAWLVWREAGLDGATAALTLWGVQLLPYLAWVSFAAMLNAAIVRLN